MLPLAGYRFLDLGQIISAPYAALLLADMGAEVTKVEPPGGEVGRGLGPPFHGGMEQIIEGISGLMSTTGSDEPMRVGIPLLDMVSGIYAALGVAGALLRRERGYGGCEVRYNMLAGGLALQSPTLVNFLLDGRNPERIGNASRVAFSEVLRTADGYLNVVPVTDAHWEALCREAGVPELARDPRAAGNAQRARHRRELAAILEPALRRCTTREWFERLSATGIPCGPIYEYSELMDDPHIRFLAPMLTIEHPAYGAAPGVKSPLAFDNEPASWTPPPTPGEHNALLLQRRLPSDSTAIRTSHSRRGGR